MSSLKLEELKMKGERKKASRNRTNLGFIPYFSINYSQLISSYIFHSLFSMLFVSYWFDSFCERYGPNTTDYTKNLPLFEFYNYKGSFKTEKWGNQKGTWVIKRRNQGKFWAQKIDGTNTKVTICSSRN